MRRNLLVLGSCLVTALSVSRAAGEGLPPVRPLFDFPVRDTCVCVGPDGQYYLTGTTGHPTWWQTNDGIRVWRSKALDTAWKPLGLVWSLDRDATWARGFREGRGEKRRAVWAPEIHYLKGTFWLAYCMNYGGTGLLRSTSGRAEGPYVDVKPDGPLTSQIDASLFQDDDGRVYFLFQNGRIARMKDDMSGLAEKPRLLAPAGAKHVGFEGAFLAKVCGKYHLLGAEFNRIPGAGHRFYDCMIATADSVYGPYGKRYLALPHAGHNMLFRDTSDRWWSTFFGNDPGAVFRERPAILPITFDADGRIRPSARTARPGDEVPRLLPETLDDLRILLPSSRRKPTAWRYTLDRPAGGWFRPDFDDSGWKEGSGGFGAKGTPNTAVRTVWETPDIWLRRTFRLDRPVAGRPGLLIHHDEDTTVYLDGIRAARVTGYTTDFRLVAVEHAAVGMMRPGVHTIAVHCEQTYGGQYIDLALVEADAAVPLEEVGAVEQNRWTRERAWKWYNGQPWPCGFNYIPANAISYTEMWMDYCFDLQRIDRELALAQTTAFNALRVVLPFVVWEHEPEAFKKRIGAFLGVCQRRALGVMLTLFDDCAFGPVRDPVFGKQPGVVVGWYANGWTPSPGHALVRDQSTWPRLERYVKDIIGAFREDDRVWVWDLYNEPTNGGLGGTSLPLVEKVFQWAREIHPSQPLTVAQWNSDGALNALIYRHSDIITFHDYGSADHLARHIADLTKHRRPLICTEWLNRGRGSLVKTCLPIFLEKRVGCLHWGLVNGKTQTHLNWGHRPGQPDSPVWQHDLYRGDHRPYDPEELELFRDHLRLSRNPKQK